MLETEQNIFNTKPKDNVLLERNCDSLSNSLKIYCFHNLQLSKDSVACDDQGLQPSLATQTQNTFSRPGKQNFLHQELESVDVLSLCGGVAHGGRLLP